MKRVLCPELPAPGRSRELSENESGHLTRVLRMRDGDRVEALDGKGNARICILRVRGKRVLIEADEGKSFVAEATDPSALARHSRAGEVVPIELESAILKGAAMEWVIEKAVELGVRLLVPLTTAHTVVQVGKRGPEAFQERWQKIADQALKQCGRLERMEIALPVDLEERLRAAVADESSPRFWADEGQSHDAVPLSRAIQGKARELRCARLLIGPEGGWSVHERDLIALSSTPVSLGPLVLRAETAALFAVSIASAAFRDA